MASGIANGPSTWRKLSLGYPGDPVPEETASRIARGPVPGGNGDRYSQGPQYLDETESGIARGSSTW